MSEELVLRWSFYFWKLVLHCATVILFKYFFSNNFRSPSYGGFPPLCSPLQVISIVHYHPTMLSSICPIEQLFWFSVSNSGWKHCSEVFSTLMRPGKLLQCIYCGGNSFSLRYFRGLITSLRTWSLSSLLESLGRLPKSSKSLPDWHSSGLRRITLSDYCLRTFPCTTIHYEAFPNIYSSSDTFLLVNGA